MSYLRKIIAWFLTFAILIFSVCVPAFAAVNPPPTDSRGNFYDWVINSGSLDADRPGGPFGPGAGGGRFSKEQYDEWVDALPAPGFSSDGSLFWSPKFKDFYAGQVIDGFKVHFYYWGCSHYVLPSSDTYHEFTSGIASADCNTHSVSARIKSGTSGFRMDCVVFRFADVRPIDGFYTLLDTTGIEGYYTTSSGRTPFSKAFTRGSSIYYDASTSVELELGFYKYVGDVITYYAQGFAPVYKVIPFEAVDTGAGGQYNITTRPTTITGGNLGIVGDNGQITTINNNQQIINETNNTYYNPATGQTGNITNWTYNYDGRIYTITLDTGDTVNVEYGDENITITENNIVEGDTITNNYTIYYIIDGGGSGDNPTPPPTTCPHAWAETSRTDPTCTLPGKVVSTCSNCGQTKTDTLPALGHDWKEIRTVPIEYDENGIQTQEGYTLYECTRCGEQYKDTDSTGPPGGDINDGDLVGFLNGIIKSLSENLSGAIDLILRFFSEIPKLFDGFTAFLAAVFPFLPDEIMLLLTFGIAALVFVGIIKAIRR